MNILNAHHTSKLTSLLVPKQRIDMPILNTNTKIKDKLTSELVFYLVCFFGFLTLRGRFLQILRVSLNLLNWLGNRISRFIRFSLLEWHFGYFVLFVLVLSHLKLDWYLVCFFGFLTLRGRF